VARIVASMVSEALGQQVSVKSKPGAGSNIAAESAVQASGARVD